MPSRVFIIPDEYVADIRLVASELERHKVTVEALHKHLLLLVGLATGLDLEIDNCELDAVRGVLRCDPTPINVSESEESIARKEEAIERVLNR